MFSSLLMADSARSVCAIVVRVDVVVGCLEFVSDDMSHEDI